MEAVSAKELDRYVEDGRTMIIDLRSQTEYARSHIRGAINVPYGEFQKELWGREADTILLYCERGALSMAVARKLEEQGCHAITVIGGIRAYRGKNRVNSRFADIKKNT